MKTLRFVLRFIAGGNHFAQSSIKWSMPMDVAPKNFGTILNSPFSLCGSQVEFFEFANYHAPPFKSKLLLNLLNRLLRI